MTTEAARDLAQQFIDEKVRAGELVRLPGGRIIEAERVVEPTQTRTDYAVDLLRSAVLSAAAALAHLDGDSAEAVLARAGKVAEADGAAEPLAELVAQLDTLKVWLQDRAEHQGAWDAAQAALSQAHRSFGGVGSAFDAEVERIQASYTAATGDDTPVVCPF